MTKPRFLTKSSLLAMVATLVLGLSQTACGPAWGSITFLWTFDGETSCAAARVDTIDVEVVNRDTDERRYQNIGIACQEGGLVIDNAFPAGEYDVYLEAYNARGDRLYDAVQSVVVASGMLTDMGTINLTSDGNEPVDGPGSLTFLWQFRYPLDLPETDCAVAGVDEVDVFLYPAGGDDPVYSQTAPCNDATGGMRIESLEVGTYDLVLSAYGSYLGDDVFLYRSETLNIAVLADTETDLGDVTLERNEDNFADIRVSWSLADTCANLGIDDLDFVITRLQGDLDVEDDAFTVSCGNTDERRLGFVPGSYVIDVSATGDAGAYVGTATVDVPPGMETSISVDVVLDS